MPSKYISKLPKRRDESRRSQSERGNDPIKLVEPVYGLLGSDEKNNVLRGMVDSKT